MIFFLTIYMCNINSPYKHSFFQKDFDEEFCLFYYKSHVSPIIWQTGFYCLEF